MAAIVGQQVSICEVIFKSPFTIFGREQQAESFPEMIKSLIAPYYHIRSITTLLMCISAIVYITLVLQYPPFIKIPTFTLQALSLEPQYLKHFEFYRIITAPFVFEDLTTLLMSQIVLWSLGSFTEEIYGWRMFTVFTGFYGLIGSTVSMALPCFLIGCIFAYFLMAWPNPQIPIFYRKVTLIIYLVVCLVYTLIFISYGRSIKYSIYSATLYGFLMSLIFGMEKDPPNLSTFRKVMQLVCGMVFIILTSIMIIYIVFERKTLL